MSVDGQMTITLRLTLWVLLRWIRVISARLERVIREEPATATAAYEPFGDPPAASALGIAIVEELAMIATPVLRVRVGIETCKFSTFTKIWVLCGQGPHS